MSRPTPYAVYERILGAADADLPIDQLNLGLTWTCCRTANAIGFAQSPGSSSRTLTFPGSIAGRPVAEVARWLTAWDPFEATVGLAAANAAINVNDNALMRESRRLDVSGPANLAVFEYFRPWLSGKKSVVIGRYPGLDKVIDGFDVTVLERHPGAHDLPDPAAEYLIPNADWVFLSATTLINKTFPRLCELASDAVTVLMGPSTPWLSGLADFGVDFLAGVIPTNVERAAVIAAEGGGTRLFGEGVTYALADIGTTTLNRLKADIAATAARRDVLQRAMNDWYAGGKGKRFPQFGELEAVTTALSILDTRYKRQWDARH